MPTEYFLSRKIGEFVYCGCPPCEILFSSMDVIVSVLNNCGCIPLLGDDTSIQLDHVTGVTGSFPTGIGSTSLGTAFVQAYGTGDQTCATPIGAPGAADVVLTTTCLGPILFPEITIAGFGLIFQSASGGRIGEIITNDLTCGGDELAIVGSVQYFLP